MQIEKRRAALLQQDSSKVIAMGNKTIKNYTIHGCKNQEEYKICLNL